MNTSGVKYECCTNGVTWRLIRPSDLANAALLVRVVYPNGTYGPTMQLHELRKVMAK